MKRTSLIRLYTYKYSTMHTCILIACSQPRTPDPNIKTCCAHSAIQPKAAAADCCSRLITTVSAFKSSPTTVPLATHQPATVLFRHPLGGELEQVLLGLHNAPERVRGAVDAALVRVQGHRHLLVLPPDFDGSRPSRQLRRHRSRQANPSANLTVKCRTALDP